jgi:hypothetical protein
MYIPIMPITGVDKLFAFNTSGKSFGCGNKKAVPHIYFLSDRWHFELIQPGKVLSAALICPSMRDWTT